MKLIVGLGNPGKEYENTRHNIGFMYLDYILGKENFTLNKKFNSMEYVTMFDGEKVVFIKPMTFMNLSGEAVMRYLDYYKIRTEDILVIQDDLDLSLGKYKLLFNHGDGGHNGIKNIILNVGNREFLRLKIGIARATGDTKEYVLGKFGKEELIQIEVAFKELKDFITDFLKLDRDRLILKYNTKNK